MIEIPDFVLGMFCGAALLALWAEAVVERAESARRNRTRPVDVGILPGNRGGGSVR